METRIESARRNNQVAAENEAAAEARIRDLDVAEETTNFAANNILQKGATAVLAQANLSKKRVLDLLS